MSKVRFRVFRGVLYAPKMTADTVCENVVHEGYTFNSDILYLGPAQPVAIVVRTCCSECGELR